MARIEDGEAGGEVRRKLNDTGLRRNDFAAETPPTPADDAAAGYEVGSRWIHGGVSHLCIDAAPGRAVWLAEGAGFPTVAALLASAAAFRPGARIRAGGFDYEATAADDPEPHLTTAGGVGLRVRMEGPTVAFDAFGPVRDGATDDVALLNRALRAAGGRRVLLSPGVYGQGVPLVLPDGADVDGGQFKATLSARPDFDGWQVESANVAALLGTDDAFAEDVPEEIRIAGLVIQGNSQNADRTAHLREKGHGVRLFLRKMQVDLRIFNVPGVGFFSEGPGGNGPTPLRPGYSRQASVRLYVHGTGQEGVIWRGPGDVKIETIYQSDAGSRLAAVENDGKRASPSYGAVNGGQTDGVVFDGHGAEVDFIHAWGNRAGCGLVQYGGRLNATLLISESNHFGGMKLLGGFGMIDRIDVHQTGGWDGDTTPSFIHASPGYANMGHTIGALTVLQYAPRGGRISGARDHIRIAAASRWLIVNGHSVSARGSSGHGIRVEDGAAFFRIANGIVNGCAGTAEDGLASSAVYRGKAALGTIDTMAVSCAVAFRSGGAPAAETIRMIVHAGAGQEAFAGSPRRNPGQSWDISGTVGGKDFALR